MKLNHVLKVDGFLRKHDGSIESLVTDFVIYNEDGLEYVSFSLPKLHEVEAVPVENITIIYDGHRLEVMGTHDNRAVFLMQLSNEAMKQITTRWLTKI